MYDVVTIGSALVDIFITSPDLEIQEQADKIMLCQTYGAKLSVDRLLVCSGGAGSNTAVGFRRLGFSTAIVAETGQDLLAQLVVQDLVQNKVSLDLLIREKKEQTGGAVIMVGKDGGRTVFVYRGAASQLDKHDLPQDALTQSRWIHLSSIGGRLEVLEMLFDMVRHFELKLSWNPGSKELKLIADGAVSPDKISAQIMILNQEEWESVAAFQSQLLERIPTVVVTNGKAGGMVFDHSSGPCNYSSSGVKSVDDTGAGDAFAVGFVGARLSGFDNGKAIEWGVANAASVVQKMGAKAGLLERTAISLV